MSNLSNKFDSLEAQLVEQNAAMLVKLDALGGKLDAIATALGAPPPTATTTLADVVAAIQVTNNVLFDVRVDTIALNEKSAAMQNTVNDIHTDTISIDQKLLRIRDAINPLGEDLPSEELSSIPWLLFRIMDAINPTWPRPAGVPAQPALHLLLQLLQQRMPDVQLLQTAVGTNSNGFATSVLGLLASMATAGDDCGCASPNKLPPSDDCASPYRSTGMRATNPPSSSGSLARTFAIFDDDLPTGVSYGGATGIEGLVHAELKRSSWTDWRMYVSSDAAQFSTSPSGAARYPTNTWLDMPPNGDSSLGGGSIVFTVADGSALTVTLCSPGETSGGGLPVCQTVDIVWGGGGDWATFQYIPVAKAGLYSFQRLDNINANVFIGVADKRIVVPWNQRFTFVTTDLVATDKVAFQHYAGPNDVVQVKMCFVPAYEEATQNAGTKRYTVPFSYNADWGLRVTVGGSISIKLISAAPGQHVSVGQQSFSSTGQTLSQTWPVNTTISAYFQTDTNLPTDPWPVIEITIL